MRKVLWIFVVIFTIQLLSFANDTNESAVNQEEQQAQPEETQGTENFQFQQELNSLPDDSDMTNTENYNKNLIKKLIAVYDLDVYLFKDSWETYNTPLKRKMYEKSTEYQAEFKKLKELRNKLLSMEFFLNINFRKKFEAESKIYKSEYSLKRKRFELLIHARKFYKKPNVLENRARTVIHNLLPKHFLDIEYWETSYYYNQNYVPAPQIKGLGFQLQNKPFSVEKINLARGYTFEHSILLLVYHYFKVNEETALQIETNGKVRLYFKIQAIKKLRYPDSDGEYRSNSIEKYYYFVTTDNRIEITHKKTGVILYKKQY